MSKNQLKCVSSFHITYTFKCTKNEAWLHLTAHVSIKWLLPVSSALRLLTVNAGLSRQPSLVPAGWHCLSGEVLEGPGSCAALTEAFLLVQVRGVYAGVLLDCGHSQRIRFGYAGEVGRAWGGERLLCRWEAGACGAQWGLRSRSRRMWKRGLHNADGRRFQTAQYLCALRKEYVME